MSTAIPRWVVVDDMNTDIQYSGPWFQDASGSQDSIGNFGPAYQSTLHGTKANASLAYAFSGTKVRVYGSNNLRNDSGVLDPVWECFVDKISIGATAPFQFAENNWVFCEQDALVDGPHVLTVNATVLKAQTFWVDQIQYVPSTSMALDQQAILIDSLDPQLELAYGQGWGALGGTANMTTQTGSLFNFDFTGISLSWYGFIPTELSHNATSGTYAVDGQTPVTFLLKGLPATSTTIYNQKFFQTPQLTAGQHKLVVTYQGSTQTTPLTLDYLVVQNGSIPSTGVSSSTGLSSSAGPSATLGASTGSNIGKNSNNIGAIVGGIVGGLAIILLAILGYLYLRRRSKQLALEEKVADYPDVIPQPFVYSPIQTTATDSHAYLQQRKQPTAQGGGGSSSHHNMQPSFSATDFSQSVMSPSSSSNNTYPSNANTVGHILSTSGDSNDSTRHALSTSTAQSSLTSGKARREAEATAAVLRQQQQRRGGQGGLHSPPLTNDSMSSRVVMHEDSGIRLPSGDAHENIVEIPPQYTPG